MVGGVALVRTDILRVADLGRARRQRQVLRIDGIDDIERRQALGQQFRGIDIDHDLAIFAAGRGRQGDAGYRRELLADAVDAVIVELLLVERVGAQADLQHRHAGSIELHHDRRLDARRHQRADGIGRRDDLRNREIEIDVGLEVDLLHRQAGHGLRFDVLDAVDVGADRILAVGGDALLHLGRAQARIAPDHRHHRDVDLREDVGRHLDARDRAQKQDQGGDDVEGVRKAQRKTNDTHGPSSRIPGMNRRRDPAAVLRACTQREMKSEPGC